MGRRPWAATDMQTTAIPFLVRPRFSGHSHGRKPRASTCLRKAFSCISGDRVMLLRHSE